MQHIPISLVFACGIDGQDTKYLTRKSWGFVIHLELIFYQVKNQFQMQSSLRDASLREAPPTRTCPAHNPHLMSTLKVGTSATR
ncbi:hypothetical protein [Nostoc sp.]